MVTEMDPAKDRKPYAEAAVQHLDHVLEEYRSGLDEITPENCSALFICSSLMVVFSFGYALCGLPRSEKDKTTIDEITDIFFLLRGSQAVIDVAWPWLQKSDLKVMLTGFNMDTKVVLPAEAEASFQRLREYNSLDRLDAEDQQVYETAIEVLHDLYTRVIPEWSDKALVHSWIMGVETSYIQFLLDRRPLALAILAHYAALMLTVSDHWWAGRWSEQLVADISQAIGAEDQHLICWPLKAVREPGNVFG